MLVNLSPFKRQIRLIAVICLLFAAGLIKAESTQQPVIAIIVDDMGNHYRNGMELINMPYPLTLAFLPQRQHTESLSKLAHLHKKEVMLHAPMENTLGLALGHGALTSEMSEQEFKQSLRQSIEAIPHIAGVNNHMGSRLTTQSNAMKWVMETLVHYPFYFVDSRTSAQSVAARTARRYAIPNMSRDIFLDHEQTRDFVRQQFNKLIEVAEKNGSAIAIAHPHRVTIDYLSLALPRLDERGIRIATVSSLWQARNPHRQMFAERKQATKLAMAQQSPTKDKTIIR